MLTLADKFKLAVADITGQPPDLSLIRKLEQLGNRLEQALLSAIIRRKLQHVRAYLAAGANPNALSLGIAEGSGWQSCMHITARECLGDMMKILIEFGGDINVPDSDGRRPLHLAVVKNHQFLCEYLLEKGANPRLTDNGGNKPFDCLRGRHMLAVNATLEKLLHDAEARFQPSSGPPVIGTGQRVKLARPLRLKQPAEA